jgi:hypothetical protein
MINLALEIPTTQLQAWSPLADFDFVLAHQVLADDGYMNHFRARPKGRMVMLDNSLHELGAPLPISDILAAARMVKADYVIAPDNMDHAKWTVDQFYEMRDAYHEGGDVIGVLAGTTPYEREYCLEHIRKGSIVCLPFRRARVEWFLEQAIDHARIHLLGMSSDWELNVWAWLQTAYPSTAFSVDTSKPIKAGLLGTQLAHGMPTRGLSISSKDLLDFKHVSENQDLLVRRNIGWLRSILCQQPGRSVVGAPRRA